MTWVLPVQLIGLAAGYIPIDANVQNQAKLEKIWINASGDRVARISSVVAEKVQAYAMKGNERVDLTMK